MIVIPEGSRAPARHPARPRPSRRRDPRPLARRRPARPPAARRSPVRRPRARQRLARGRRRAALGRGARAPPRLHHPAGARTASRSGSAAPAVSPTARPYAALLIARHALQLFGGRRGEEGWDPFLDFLEDFARDLLAETGVSREELEADYRWIDLADLIALTACRGAARAGGALRHADRAPRRRRARSRPPRPLPAGGGDDLPRPLPLAARRAAYRGDADFGGELGRRALGGDGGADRAAQPRASGRGSGAVSTRCSKIRR